MTRAVLILRNQADRDKAAAWCRNAPAGTRVEFKQVKRSLPQNDLMWSLLTSIASQKEHSGRRYTADQWKCIFMHALGQEIQFIPSLSGDTFIPWGNRSSDLSKEEMTQLIEFILAWGAENGVSFNDDVEAA